MGNTITRPDLVGRMLAAAYPEGVPPEQVRHVARIAAALDVVADAVATGRPFAGFPLTLAADASRPALFDVERVEPAPPPAPEPEDEPVPYVPVEPPSTPSPPSPPRAKHIRYEDLPVGLLTDPMVAAIAGCSANAVGAHRSKRRIATAWQRGGAAPEPFVFWAQLLRAWGRPRLDGWLERWPRARELYGEDIARAIAAADAPPRARKPAKWTEPETSPTSPEPPGITSRPENEAPQSAAPTSPETSPPPEPPPLCAPRRSPDDILADGRRRGGRVSLPVRAMPAPAAIPPSRQAELDAIAAAVAAGKVTRVPSNYVEPPTRPANPKAGARRGP